MVDSYSEEFGRLKALLQHLNANDLQAIRAAIVGLKNHAAVCYAEHFLTRTPENLGDEENELSLCLNGWQHYYLAEYEKAGEFFLRARQQGQVWGSWSALGLGKACSDLGHWAIARKWLLEALRQARRENDIYRLAEAYGSLGEVFFRSGHFRPAYEQFVIDARLLPPGSGHHYRLNNYMGVCLGRLGCPELARPILWESFHGARERAPISAWFSLASLYTLSVYCRDVELFKRLECVEPLCSKTGAEMPNGFINCARAYWYWSSDRIGEAITALGKGTESFGSIYSVEQIWVERLCSEMERKPWDKSRLLRIQRRHIAVGELYEDGYSLIDEHLRNTPLHKGARAFDCLEQTMGVKELWDLWKIFFI